MSITIRSLLLCAMLALFTLPAAPTMAQDRDVDVSYFYDELDQYGRWMEHPRWGDVWSPDVDPDWRPYTMGYWSYTDDNGWFWVSEEPFGWAVFHYGRWVLDPDDGWLWIPGTEWGPAWVAWRSDDSDDGYVGWAPLPPDSRWGSDGYLMYDEYYYDGPQFAPAWVFVRPLYLTAPGMYRYAAPRPQNYIFLRRTKPLHAYRKFDRGVFNAGLDVRLFERRVGRPMPRVQLRSISSPRDQNFRPGGPEISVFRPNIIQPQGGEKRRPNFRDRPPGDRVPFVNRTPDSKPGGWPGDKGPDRSKDGSKGPMFKDTNKGPDGRPDLRDGKKDGEGWKGAPKSPGSASKEPFGTQGQGNQGQGNQGQGLYKGPPNNDPPKQPFVKEGFKGPDNPDKGRGPDTGAKEFKGPLPSGQNQPAFKGPPQKPVVQDQRPPKPPEQHQGRPPEQKPKPPERKDEKKDDKKGPPGSSY
jgi:hypothetical protein